MMCAPLVFRISYFYFLCCSLLLAPCSCCVLLFDISRVDIYLALPFPFVSFRIPLPVAEEGGGSSVLNSLCTNKIVKKKNKTLSLLYHLLHSTPIQLQNCNNNDFIETSILTFAVRNTS